MVVNVKPSVLQKETIKPDIKQAEASDPLESVWVGASAGTGKTRVLTNRVLRLLLPRPGMGKASATPPHKILCLTFTKTAAAEMSSRIYSDLSSWSVKNDVELRQDLQKLGIEPDADIEEEARKLFAKVLDTPGGLKIMTIHSFCQSVLKRFPVESSLSPHFELTDEQGAAEYLTKALHDIVRETKNNPEHEAAKAFKLLALHLDSEGMAELMGQVMSKRSLLKSIIDHHKNDLIPSLYKGLGVEKGMTEKSVIADLRKTSDEEKFKIAINALLKGSDKDKDRADKISRWLEKGDNFNAYKSIFITTKNEMTKRLPTKDAIAVYPEILDLFKNEGERVLDVFDKTVALKQAELNEALLVIAGAMIGRYEKYKSDNDRLDYDDLIIKTSELLAEKDMVPWVLFKLDSGIDHILVDEAQDTSRSQWQIVKALSEEFFEKHGSRENVIRTLFVVGDEKQSIFSFQGADPKEFDSMYRFLDGKIKPVILNYSFRSTEAVLKIVDDVFANSSAKKGVVADMSTEVQHKAFREGQAGLVELWPIITPDEKEETKPWRLPSEVISGETTDVMLAQKISSTIKGWLVGKEKLVSKGRNIKAGDIIILVQSRGSFVKLLMRTLKTAGVPVAGFDKIKLADEIAISDLLALAQFSLLPKDDLNLAALLKSPLLGMSETEIFDLCYNRKASLWEVLRNNTKVAGYLRYWVEKSGKTTPYEFFAEALNKSCVADSVSGRKAFYARLGYDVEEVLEEFLGLALKYEQSHIPSLQGFVNWFLKGSSEIKREQENGENDEIRIMTAHGAKGLQAPIIFIADAAKKGHDHNKAKVRLLWPEDKTGLPLWASSEEFESLSYKEKRKLEAEKRDEEYRRLLYVAMTRAEDRLYICGCRGKNAEKEDCWHRLISKGFPSESLQIPFMLNDKHLTNKDETPLFALRFENPQVAIIKEEKDETKIDITKKPLPKWVFEPAGGEPVPPKPLAPSRQDEEPSVKSPIAESEKWKYNRGNIVHKLLEILPDISEERWSSTIENYLSSNVKDIPEKERKDLQMKILEVLRHKDFSSIFGKGSRAEVPIVGVVGKYAVSGKIDRLLITDKEVMIVDYKSNRNPPESVEHIPVVYLKQLSLYRELIRKIYPQHNVKTSLLWTEKPVLMSIDNDIIDSYKK